MEKSNHHLRTKFNTCVPLHIFLLSFSSFLFSSFALIFHHFYSESYMHYSAIIERVCWKHSITMWAFEMYILYSMCAKRKKKFSRSMSILNIIMGTLIQLNCTFIFLLPRKNMTFNANTYFTCRISSPRREGICVKSGLSSARERESKKRKKKWKERKITWPLNDLYNAHKRKILFFFPFFQKTG